MMLVRKRSIDQKHVLPLVSRNSETYRLGQSWIQCAEASLWRIQVWTRRAACVQLWSIPGHDLITFRNHLVIALMLTA
jgi:hypothetical protein